TRSLTTLRDSDSDSPRFTRVAARARFSLVMRFNAPSSSSAPHRFQLLMDWKYCSIVFRFAPVRGKSKRGSELAAIVCNSPLLRQSNLLCRLLFASNDTDLLGEY